LCLDIEKISFSEKLRIFLTVFFQLSAIFQYDNKSAGKFNIVDVVESLTLYKTLIKISKKKFHKGLKKMEKYH